MEEEEDTDSEEVEEYSGMEQPPLIKQLKGILAEYPDDGQIIKELIQNAEDAGATEMKILYDGRTINKQMSKKIPYRKFFMGPALCFYNNAVFTDNDWHGIRMIYSSVKEEDPLKVGRFGLGFKSVFHITDHPCIISGQRLLLMNPHEKNPDKVCITIKLANLEKCRRLDIQDFAAAFDGTCGFSVDCLNTGSFSGTLFWFPLRKTPSNLSDTTYDGSKIMDLFKSFQTEAVDTLLFLKSLCKVELQFRDSTAICDLPDGQPFFVVELEDPTAEVKDRRKTFLKQIKDTRNKATSANITSVTTPKFKTRLWRTEIFQEVGESSWVIVNMFKAGKMSNKLKSLVQDKDLSYSPFVGVAAPLEAPSGEFKGHIFCFLPLPQETKSLTGLPVHVNGFFAMSQNRRHLKWASADQETYHMHRDKAIEWNECLVNEVLPEAYICLINELIAICQNRGNSMDTVKTVYSCIPALSKVNDKWQQCVRHLHKNLVQTKLVFIKKHDKWTKPSEPLYTMFDRQNVSQTTKDSVIKVLQFYPNIKDTHVPDHIWEFLKDLAKPRDVSPLEVAKLLKTEDNYSENLTQDERLNILDYILKNQKFSVLQGLKLLPMEDGSFNIFRQKGSGTLPVYMCTKQESRLFPGLENKLVSTQMSEKLRNILLQLSKQGTYQIEVLTVHTVAQLLSEVAQNHFGDKDPVVVSFTGHNQKLSDWMEHVWDFIMKCPSEKLLNFAHIPLLPSLQNGSWLDASWKNTKLLLYKLTNVFVVKLNEDMQDISESIYDALTHLSVTVLNSLPPWINADKLPCVYYLTPSGIPRLLDRLSEIGTLGIVSFNTSCKASEREAFVNVISHCRKYFKRSSINYLKKLNLFQFKASLTECSPSYTCVISDSRIANINLDFPIRLPQPMLVASSENSLLLACTLGAKEINVDQMVLLVLEAISNDAYSRSEVDTFMKWFLEHVDQYKTQNKVMTIASKIAFVPSENGLFKPSELYDSKDNFLKALFFGEKNKFPVKDYTSDIYLHGLKKLGLNTRKNVLAGCLYTTATVLDKTFRAGETNLDVLQKAKALFVYFEENADSLESFVEETGQKLHSSIRRLRCIPQRKNRPKQYPKELPWEGSTYTLCSPNELKGITFTNIVGSVQPLVKYKSKKIGELFQWHSLPDLSVLTSHLKVIQSCYTSANKPQFLPLISDTFKAMAEMTLNRNPDGKKQLLLQEHAVWWGDGFCLPKNIVLETRKGDIDLKPYMYTLPAELQGIKSFFGKIGCQQVQNERVLLDVLDAIARHHEKNTEVKKHRVRKDLNLVLQILNKLFEEKLDVNDTDDGLLFPIHTDDDTQLTLKPCNKCIYCDAKWLRDVTTESCEDEEIYYVHGEVPAHVSEGLGVRSLRQHLMSDTEGLAEWGQEEPLTRRLHSLLKEGYTDGLSVPKELIQNADDAGATDCFFIYDERQNLDARTHLLDDDMADWQGPALWAYNNGIFSEDDLQNITKLSGATKETDTTKIGKFGLGFCAVYNLTDVPSFVSGKNLVMFDPHMTFLGKVLPGKSPGLRIDLQRMKNVRMLKRLTNQFKPFQDVLGCDLSVSKKELFFPGTLFRFPLRTQKQAATSLIKNLCYSKDEILKLLKQFAEASGNMLLFTQKLENIKVLHIPESSVLPSKAEVFITVSKETLNNCLDKSVLEFCTDMKQNATLENKPYEGLQQINIIVKCLETVELLSDLRSKSSNTSWLVSWATGTARSLQLCNTMNMKGLLPLGGVAMLIATEKDMLEPKSLRSVPFGFYNTGHIFCYLPLPERTHLQVHINGSFAVTSERRSLQSDTEDDKYTHASDWNEALLEDAVVNAFIHLLICLRAEKSYGFQPLSPDYTFYKLWPLSTRNCPKISSFISGFYSSVIHTNIPILSCGHTWIGVRSCLFLEKSLRYDPAIGESALSTLQKFNRSDEVFIVDLPLSYFDELEKISEWKTNCHIITKEKFFKDYFLTNISDEYWDKKETTKIRNALLLHCLELSTCEIHEILTLMDCIPTKPNGILRKPRDLVYPNGELVHLFNTEDNRFPENKFSSHSILSRLCSLGMMKTKLNPNVLVDRVSTVSKIAEEIGYTKALERCRYLVEYLGSCDEIAEEELSEIRKISFLPILAKPKTWPFSWKSNCIIEANETCLNTDLFANPTRLFTFDCFELVCCIQTILDTDSLRIRHNQTEIFARLGVKTFTDVSFENVVQQLSTICRDETEAQLNISLDIAHSHAKNLILERIYKFINDILLEEPERAENVRSLLQNKPVIYLNNKFLPPNKVAFSVVEDCSPELYGIGQQRINRYGKCLKAIGVREHFEIGDVVEVLKGKKLHYREAIIPPEEVRLICRLLHCLTDLMEKSSQVYSDLDKCLVDYIVAPDTNRVLTPTYMLCFDDCDFVETSDTMKFIHADISRTVANILGVFTKRNKHIDSCSVEIPFEQKEELLTRLQGLLDGYPCDSGIMKELIQNADDASASEIHFVKDYRQHGDKTIFTDSFVEFQGPALCVFNDSFFTQEDFIGIQRLGMGSKSDDPTKTGQYGVGFNAVYNLTDLPSFLTKGPGIEGGETLCIFDPLHKHVSERVGTRYVNMKAIRSTYPDVISGYNEKMFFSDSTYKGTVFRFPLRQTESAISTKLITKGTLDTMFETFKKDMPETLLFLKHLTKITVSKITEDEIKTEWTVSMSLTEDDAIRRSSFSNSCKQFSWQLKNKNYDVLTKKPTTVKYKLQTKNRLGIVESWFVVQRIGVLGECIPDNIERAFLEGKLGLLPIGGVAVRVPSMSHFQADRSVGLLEDQLKRRRQAYKTEQFRAFCFLPLPGATGIPMHINAHFALDHEARRGLWKEDQGLKSDWNKLLLSTVVGPAYIDALKFIKSVLFFQDKAIQQNMSRPIALESVMLFSAFFPDARQIQDKDWGFLVKGVCQTMSTDLYKLFPVVVKEKHEKNNISRIHWNALHQKQHAFPVYFARNDKGFILSESLLELLTSIGMKITALSFDVQQSLIDSEISVSMLSPDAVIRYLKSFFCIEDASGEGSPIPCLVSESQFETVENVNEVLAFCSRSNTFESDLEKLPLLVTNDGMMRCFDENSRAFCTRHFKLLPNSGSKFVHQRQIHALNVLGRTNFNSVISEFHIRDFAQILQTELDNHEILRQDIVDFDAIELPFETNKWLVNLWIYLEEDYENQKKSENTDTFITFLDQIKHCCFIPTAKGRVSKHLVKISKIYSVLSIESFASIPPLEASIRKLEIPHLDKSLLPEKSVHLLSSGLAHADNPVSILICLKYYRAEIGLKGLSVKDCFSILGYFSDNLISMQNNDKVDNGWVSDSLRCLPLYITKEGHMVSLGYEFGKVLVLPDEIPKDGLEQWAETTGTILLRNNSRLTKLYEFLGFTYTDEIDVYLEHILSTWSALPDHAVFIHLKYIKDHLLGQRVNLNLKQNRLIQDLKVTCLIVDNNVRKKGSAYFSPHHDVFKIMCEKEDFPPKHMWSYEWQRFLELIGVKCQMPGALFIQFAKACAAEGRVGISEQSAKKSRVLIEHLLSSSTAFDSNTYTEISKIKFIVPYIVDKKYTNVHPQYSQVDSFICYHSSVSYKYSQLVWSSMNLFPKWADPSQYNQKKKEKGLCVHHEPPLDNIIKHCQNVCDSLKTIFEHERSNRTTSYQWIELFMDDLYSSLQSKGLSSDEIKLRLYHTPLVFFPETKLLVPAHQVIEDMSSDQEIDPYLLKAPVRYGKFFPLFTYLGAEKRPTCKSYIKVLAKIKADVQDDQLDERYLPEWGAIRMAVDNLFHCLKPSQSNSGHSREFEIPSGTILYLPNKEKKMSPSSALIVPNSRLYFERLNEANDLQYFIGLKALDSTYSTSSIKWLPKEIQPKFLSDIVCEEVDTTQMVEVPKDSAAWRLETFIQSDYFITGLLRLLKHFKAEDDSTASGEGTEDILLRIQNTKVKKVKGLMTYLLLNGVRIDSSAEPKECFIPKPAENGQTMDIQIFLQTKSKSDMEFIQSIDIYLIEYAYYVTGYHIPEYLIIKLFQKLKDPSNIDKMLDKLSIRPYDFHESRDFIIFPQPGTYVPVELHHLLNCEFSDFKPHEYRAIALELEDAGVMDIAGVQDSYTPVYIYAKIEKPMPSEGPTPYFSQRYMVFTGSEKVVVPAFRIYKFIRYRSDSTSLELMTTDIIPETRQDQCLSEILYSVRHTLQEAWNLSEEDRRHVIKRLYLRWHPDKNLGNEEFCGKVFRYIKEVISKLEHGIPLDENDQTRQSRAYPDFTSSSYFKFCERMNTRGKSHRTYAQDFYGGDRSWRGGEFARRRSGFGDSFVHRESQKQEYKDLGEAHRWQWQAKVDVRHASETINYAEGEPSAYNWICYLCHQAAEKSFKAAGFARDANNVDKNNFDLVSLARQLNERLTRLASELSDLVGDTSKLRYPDVLQRPKIPSSMYTRDQAQRACELARQIIEIVGEEYAL